MRFFILLVFSGLAWTAVAQAPAIALDFWQQQLAYARVRAAYTQRWPVLVARLQAQHLAPARLEVFFRLLRTSRTLEV